MAALLLTASAPAWADGPHIAFHAIEGAYAVTVFSAPDPLVAGPVELTLLLQSAADGSLLRTASGSGELTLPGHAPVRFALVAGTPGKGLPETTVTLAAPGTYGLALRVTAPRKTEASFRGVLPVAANHGKRNMVLWAVFLPLLGMVFFLANQQGKRRIDRVMGTG